ncbi:MAG: hypothetical protein M3Q65_23940, partial [Chloroflexota bacterium]|nr:hypothetical protein [Chloroflexota bacterium]
MGGRVNARRAVLSPPVPRTPVARTVGRVPGPGARGPHETPGDQRRGASPCATGRVARRGLAAPRLAG